MHESWDIKHLLIYHQKFMPTIYSNIRMNCFPELPVTLFNVIRSALQKKRKMMMATAGLSLLLNRILYYMDTVLIL